MRLSGDLPKGSSCLWTSSFPLCFYLALFLHVSMPQCKHHHCNCEEGVFLHQLLPRTLAMMSQSTQGSNSGKRVAEISAAMKAARLHGDDADSDQEQAGNDEPAWTAMLLEAFAEADAEQSYTQLIQKRKRLTFSAFEDPLMNDKILAVEALVQPSLHGMYELFKRTDLIARLDRLPPSDHDQRLQLEQECLGCTSSVFFAKLHGGVAPDVCNIIFGTSLDEQIDKSCLSQSISKL